MVDQVRTRDFSRRYRQLDFTADGETHICLPVLPPETVQEVLALTRREDIRTEIAVMTEIFDIVMTPAEATKIHARFKKDAKNPLGLVQLLDIVTWLVEEYTQRPTTPSVSSSTSSQTEFEAVGVGTSSTAGPQLEESTHLS